MDSTSLEWCLRNQSADLAVFESVKVQLERELSKWMNIRLLTSIIDDNRTTRAFSMIQKELHGSSAVLMSTLSPINTKPTMFLGLLSADVLCGAFASVNGLDLYATGDSDGLVTLFSCMSERTKLAEMDCGDSRNRPVLKIIHLPNATNLQTVSFWVVYADSVDQITCAVVADSVTPFFRTMSLKFSQNALGTFKGFEILDSRLGKHSLLALHFLSKSSAAFVVPLNTVYAHSLCEKAKECGVCYEGMLDSSLALQIIPPKGLAVTVSSIHPSSVRTWAIAMPTSEYDGINLKELLCSFSFTASALLNNKAVLTRHYTVAEQRIADTIVKLGSDAFSIPTWSVSYSPSDSDAADAESDKQGTVVLYHCSRGEGREGGDFMTALSSSDSTDDHSASTASSLVKRNEDFEMERTQRMIVLESALAAGLGSVLANYVLAQSENWSTFSREYVLADVGAVFEWTEGVYRQTAEQAFRVTEEIVVPYLVHRRPGGAVAGDDSVVVDLSLVSAGRLQIISFLGILDCVGQLLSALSSRKRSCYTVFGVGNTTSNSSSSKEAREQHQSALFVLGGLAAEVKVLKGVLKSVLIAMDLSSLHLSCIYDHSHPDISLSNLRLGRLKISEEMMFLSDSLLSEHLLIDHLVDRVFPAAQHAAVLPTCQLSDQLNEPLDPQLYTALAMFLWLPMLSIQAELKEAESSSVLPSNEYTTVSQSVVMYTLMDALLLSGDGIERVESFSRELGSAHGMTTRSQMLLTSLWNIDLRIGEQEAVGDLCTSTIALYEDTSLFLAVTCRLLSYGAKKEAKELLTHSYFKSALMKSEVGILALAAASIEKNVWEFAWHSARKLCSALRPQQTDPNAQDGTTINTEFVISSAKKSVCSMICRWALVEGEMGSFLESVMDDEEQEVVFEILMNLAAEELSVAMLPAPFVDTLIIWLAMNRRAAQALQIHTSHIVSLRSLQRTEEVQAQLQSLELREILLKRYLMLPSLSNRALRNVTGRLQVDPTLSFKQPIFYSYPMTENKNISSMQKNYASETDVPISAYSSTTEDYFPDSSSPSIDSIVHTPLTSKGERFPSSSDSDGNQSFATARGKWSTFRTEIADAHDGGDSDIPGTEFTSKSRRSQYEAAFLSPARSISQLEQNHTLPFDSAVKKIGFNTGDAISSDYVIRDAFDGFSPAGHGTRAGLLPIRRKVRFSEG